MDLSQSAPTFYHLLDLQPTNNKESLSKFFICIGKMMINRQDNNDQTQLSTNKPSLVFYGKGHGKTVLAKFIQDVVAVSNANIQVYDARDCHDFKEICDKSTTPFIVTTKNADRINADCIFMKFQIVLESSEQDVQMYEKLQTELTAVRHYCASAYLNSL